MRARTRLAATREAVVGLHLYIILRWHIPVLGKPYGKIVNGMCQPIGVEWGQTVWLHTTVAYAS